MLIFSPNCRKNCPARHITATTCKENVFGILRHKRFSKITFYRPPTKLRKGNVFIGVCHSVQGRGNDALDFPVQPPLPGHRTWYPLALTPRRGTSLNSPLLVTSGSHHWRPVQTCSLKDTPPGMLPCPLLCFVHWIIFSEDWVWHTVSHSHFNTNTRLQHLDNFRLHGIL